MSSSLPPLTGTTRVSPVVREDVARICERFGDRLGHLEGATVLVTGAAGFLPSYFVDALAHANESVLSEPCQIVCVDNFVTGTTSRLAHLQDRDDVELIEADLIAGLDLGDRKVNFIVHGASIASPIWYRKHPLETIDVNVTGTRVLLDLAREHGATFLYLSSSEIYGDPPPEAIPTSEEYWGHVSCTGPRACYDESKRLAETLTVTYHDLYDLPIRIVRPFNVYGPRLRLDDGRIIPDLLRSAIERKPITLYSDGQVTRSLCYVADFAAAMLLLLDPEVPDGPYNVGNDEEATIEHVARTFDEVANDGRGVRFEVSEDVRYLTDNPQRRQPNLAKITSTIDWRPEVLLREGLARTFRSYVEQDGS